MSRSFVVAAALLGASAVALGAFAAHGLEEALTGFGYAGAELARRVDNFATASRYQLATAAAVLAAALLSEGRTVVRRGAWALVGGVTVFSGLLYLLAFTGENWRWLGAVVPLGGLAMITGWLLIGLAALAGPPRSGGADVRADQVRLEELLSHQQRLLQELNEAVVALRDETDAAQRRQAAAEQAMRRLIDSAGAEGLPHEKPPHY